MRYPRAALETSQPWRGSYRNTGECKHENADHLMAGERWALVDDPVSEFGQRVTQCEQLRCLDCGAWLSLGPAQDAGEHAERVAVEVRAAELAGDPTLLSQTIAFSFTEHMGWFDQEVAGTRVRGVTVNMVSVTGWQAGYLARSIAEHEATHQGEP